MVQSNEFNSQSIIDTNSEALANGVSMSKRSASVILPAIKPEPDTLSPSCISTLIEPTTPTSKSMLDNCSTNSTSPLSTSITIEANTSPSNGQQQTQQSQSQSNSNLSNDNGSDSFPLQCIRFSPFQQQSWHILCDQSLQEL